MSRGLGFVLRVSRWLLRFYPSEFRASHGQDYLVTAEHRWRRERECSGEVAATVRTLRVLVGDGLVAIPSLYRSSRHASNRRLLRGLVSGWPGELRLALRALASRPGYALLVTATLGLGIGASVAVFGALDRLLLRPLPYRDADRLVYLAMHVVERGWRFMPPAELVARWRADARTIERIELYGELSMVQVTDGPAELVSVVGLSAGLPEMLAIRPLLGRMLGPADATPDATPAIMLPEHVWRNRYGGDAAVVGRTLQLNDTVFTVVGVWPASARLDTPNRPVAYRLLSPNADERSGVFTLVLARLSRGATVADAESELTTLAASIDLGWEGVVPVVLPPYGFLGTTFVRGVWMAFAAGMVLMIVAVVSTANMALSRASSRAGEIGMRLALGGSPLRIARLFLTESLILAAAGVAFALIVALLAGRALTALGPGAPVPAHAGGGLGGRVVPFAVALAFAAAIFCAAVPLMLARTHQLVRLAGQAAGRHSGSTSRTRDILVAGQTALAVLLVTGASLMARSLVRLLEVDTGVAIEHVATFALDLRGPSYTSSEAREVFILRARDALASVPGVVAVTSTNTSLLRYSIRNRLPFLDGEQEPDPERTSADFTLNTSVPPGYFEVTGIPILRGRDFLSGETGVVIVNEAFARRHGGRVVGRSLRFPGDTAASIVIGVVGNVRAATPGSDDDREAEDGAGRVQLYHPARDQASARFVLRTAGPPAPILRAARERIADLDRDTPFRDATTGPDLLREQSAHHRFLASLLAAFGALGLAFAVTGVYGTVSLDVARRSREIGVRLALGASRGAIAGSVLRRGLTPVAGGAALGLAAALAAGPLLDSLIFGIHARDPFSAAAGVLLMLATAALACILPARRAASLDPIVSLRE